MSIDVFKNEVSEEVERILSSNFTINVSTTKSVPHFGDSNITFPNLDDMSQSCKIIETCVLYIDIRRSTELNFIHKPKTVSKLYSAFVRSMIKCAKRHNGHVRGIIGDRIMVVFDAENSFVNSVNTAISMNSVSKYVINKYFTNNEVTCGIGIDYGKMLATKTGFRRNGIEQQNYRNLVWLGKPANVASKLTDIANKPSENMSLKKVHVAYDFGSGLVWSEQFAHEFVNNINIAYLPSRIVYNSPYFASFFLLDHNVEITPKTPPILMTESVYNGFKSASPNDPCIVNKWLYHVNVPNYKSTIYGGDVIFKVFEQ